MSNLAVLDRLMAGFPWALERAMLRVPGNEWSVEGHGPQERLFRELGSTPDAAVLAAIDRLTRHLGAFYAELRGDRVRRKSDYEIQVVSVYCYLGAKSQAQYSGCVDHVSLSDVAGYAERGSRAARRALELGDFTYCGYRRCVEDPGRSAARARAVSPAVSRTSAFGTN